MGCLRVHSKYSLACHWLFNWPGMEEQEFEEEFFGDEHELGRFPVRMAVGLRQMAWVLLIDEDFRRLSLFGIQPLWLYLCKT